MEFTHRAVTVEREVKLRFDSPAAARAAVLAAGAAPLHGRRLQDDGLYDTADQALRHRRCVLRLRREEGAGRLTFKGPTLTAAVKTRAEDETTVGDADVMRRILEALGFRMWFRYQKYREEFGRHDVMIAIDETPVGTFVEIEGDEEDIAEMAGLLGRSPSDYVLDSYHTLFLRHCQAAHVTASDMLFDRP